MTNHPVDPLALNALSFTSFDQAHRPPEHGMPSQDGSGTRIVADTRGDDTLNIGSAPTTPEQMTASIPEGWMPGDAPVRVGGS